MDLELKEFNPESGTLYRAGIFPLAGSGVCSAEEAMKNARRGYLCAVSENKDFFFASHKIIEDNISSEKIRTGLKKAIKNNEFKVYLQFIAENKSEKICGAEVLSRWDNPEKGILSPGAYIGIMKDMGFISKHDCFIFDKTCALLEKWQKEEKYKNLFLTCNFTRISVGEENFYKKIKDISDKYDFPHKNLIIEMTEDSLIQDGLTAKKNISECKKMGFKIAIDDMGSGFSSISDLYENEIDIVKVDKKFITEGVNMRSEKLLCGMISLAHGLGASVICEGIETEAQRSYIRKTECEMLQGYYYSRTLPYKEAMRYLNNSSFFR